MARPTTILLKLPSGSEVFLSQIANTVLEGGINALTYEGGGYVVYVPEPNVEEWEQ